MAAEQLVCGAGSDELIGLLVQAYAGPGDEVLHSAHGFLMFALSARACGATPTVSLSKVKCNDYQKFFFHLITFYNNFSRY